MIKEWDRFTHLFLQTRFAIIAATMVMVITEANVEKDLLVAMVAIYF